MSSEPCLALRDIAPILAEDHPVYTAMANFGKIHERCVLYAMFHAGGVYDAYCELPQLA
jgi:hypothetical protein